MARTHRSLAIGFAPLLLAGCIFGGSSDEDEVAAQAPTPVPAPTPTPVAAEASTEIPDADARESDKPTIFIDLAGSVGQYDHDTSGSNFADGDTVGAYAGFQIEALAGVNWGAGLAIEGSKSDDDLFEHSGFPDSEAQQLDAFVYMLGLAADTDTFRLPIRVGPYVHTTTIEETSTDLDFDWNGIGFRAEVEPEEWITLDDDFGWGLYAQGSVGVHRTFIEAEAGGFSADYNGRGMTYGAGFGVQALFGDHLKTRLGYLWRSAQERDSHSDLGLFVKSMRASFSGVVLEVGLRF